jgi:hypothetical protein
MRPPATRRRFPYGYRSAVDGRACLAVQRAVCPDLVYPPTPLGVSLESTAAQAHRPPAPRSTRLRIRNGNPRPWEGGVGR